MYAPALIRFARTFAPLYAEDMVHDVFLKIWETPVFDLPDGELKRILFASVRNACIDRIRRTQTENRILGEQLQLQADELAFAENADDLYLRNDLMAFVMKKIEELPEKSREVFLKSYIDGWKASEIAEQMNLSVRTVENHLYRALVYLRKHCTDAETGY
jgi:RNA polymerase sigma-70 factor (ECF subfamily)